MIHEWRRYRLKPGAAVEYLTLLADEGLPLVTQHLPLMGFWLAETGGLNVLHHLWSYTDWAERETARATLALDDAWMKGFIPRAFALVEEQQNCILRLDRGSRRFSAALDARHRIHTARPPGAPLFADLCAVLMTNAAPDSAEAVFHPLSGEDTAPLSLLPRSDTPLPVQPMTKGTHCVLRPLAFSPL